MRVDVYGFVVEVEEAVEAVCEAVCLADVA